MFSWEGDMVEFTNYMIKSIGSGAQHKIDSSNNFDIVSFNRCLDKILTKGMYSTVHPLTTPMRTYVVQTLLC